MQFNLRWIVAAGVLLVLTPGCGRDTATATAGGPAQGESKESDARRVPTQPNPQLYSMDLFLGTQRIRAEVARTMKEIQTGMMFRTAIGEDQGMLFVFARPHRASFWMKNVTVPLSAAYIDAEGRILEIHDLQPGNESPVWSKTPQVQYVLETSQGWFERHQINAGTWVATEKGSLSYTFFGRN